LRMAGLLQAAERGRRAHRRLWLPWPTCEAAGARGSVREALCARAQRTNPSAARNAAAPSPVASATPLQHGAPCRSRMR
jgi:hypothetical protein